MRDLGWLRDHLYAVLVATPLLSGCPGGGQRPPVGGGGGEPLEDAGVAATERAAEPFPTTTGNCQNGTWCGPRAEAEPFRDGPEDQLGCPVRLFDEPHEWKRFELIEAWTQGVRDAGDAELCCYSWWNGCTGGRPYGAPARPEDDSPAARWLALARTEHASVASFARASLELLAVGAPAALIAGCHRAALDELRHAEACLAIASRHAGRPLALDPVPALSPRGGGLVRVALDTYLEGCVAETHGAVVALDELPAWIARDEARHAALAWQIVAWTIEAGGAEVRAALARVRVAPPPEAPAAAHDAWREIIAPMTRRLLAAA